MFFHWPDHVIGKRESRRIREEHNATVNKLLKERDELKTVIVSVLPLARNGLRDLEQEANDSQFDTSQEEYEAALLAVSCAENFAFC